MRASWPEHLQRRYIIRDFIRDELPDVYAMTDLVLARAGAGTIAELAGLGLPSILVLVRAGAAVMVRQDDATPRLLHETALAILDDTPRRQAMADAARSLGNLEAAARLTDLLIELASAP